MNGRQHSLEQERAVQSIIAAAQALRPWTAQFSELVTHALAGIAEDEAAATGELRAEQLLAHALARVLRVNVEV